MDLRTDLTQDILSEHCNGYTKMRYRDLNII